MGLTGKVMGKVGRAGSFQRLLGSTFPRPSQLLEAPAFLAGDPQPAMTSLQPLSPSSHLLLTLPAPPYKDPCDDNGPCPQTTQDHLPVSDS